MPSLVLMLFIYKLSTNIYENNIYIYIDISNIYIYS